MAFDIKALEEEAAAEEAAAKAVGLSEDERRAAAALERRDKAREERAAAEKARRGLQLAALEKDARDEAAGRYLVRGVDLVDLFPLGSAPSPERLPGGGVIVVRSPDPARMNAASMEIEAKRRPLSDILADLVCESTVRPDVAKDQTQGAKLRAFCEAYPGAATNAGDEVVKLGGLKSKADKRGRT